MKEILFRGKTIDTNDWAFGSLVYSPSENQYYIIEHCAEELSFPVDTETIGQYTGLTDKNGKKIFEGDIVRLREQKNKKLVIGEIQYKGHGFYLIKNNNGHLFANGFYGISEVEVINNIHGNPELLEEVFDNESSND